MKYFQINELERLSGIKAHTIRIWESRYGLINPERDAINCRLYSLTQAVQLLEIALLLQNGFKISKLARMPETELQAMLDNLQNLPGKQLKVFIRLFKSMYLLDAGSFNKILEQFLVEENTDALITGIIYPFLQKTALLWHGNRLIEEHFVVTAIRQKLMIGIEQASANNVGRKEILLFLPNENQLDLALLYASYQLNKNGIGTFYLGNDVTIDNLLPIVRMRPKFIYTYLPVRHRFDIGKLSRMVAIESPDSRLIITFHPQAKATSIYKNVLYFNIEDALSYINMYTSLENTPQANIIMN